MNIYLLNQTEKTGYDTYDSCVVIANNEEEAKLIHPNGYDKYREELKVWLSDYDYEMYLYGNNIEFLDSYSNWCKSTEAVTVTYVGEFKSNIEDYPSRIICASFNAG